MPSTIGVECINKGGDLVTVIVNPGTHYWEEGLAEQGKIVVGYTEGGHPSKRLTIEQRLEKLSEHGITFRRERTRRGLADVIVVTPGSEVDIRRKEMAESLAVTARQRPASKAALDLAQLNMNAWNHSQEMIRAQSKDSADETNKNAKPKKST